MKTEKVAIGNLREHYDRFIDILDDFIFRTGIREKNAFRFTLLAEEAVRLAESIVGSGEYVDIWLEGDSDTAYIYLSTDQKLDMDQQEEFISVSSSGKNEAPRTFFDFIKNKFEKPEKSTWSLKEYEEDLKAKKSEDTYSQEAWDDLERSVLARLSDEITVSAKNGNMTMQIRKSFGH